MAALLAVALGLGTAAAPAGPHSPVAQSSKGSRTALHIGDSLGVGTDPYLKRALGRRWTVKSRVEISLNVGDGIELLKSRHGSIPPVVVIGLGTNDYPRAVDTFNHDVRKVLRLIGPRRCVVWANIVRPPVDGAGYEAFNRVLKRVSRRRNVRMLNWVRLVRNHRGWLGSDGVHVVATGYQARGRATAKAIRKCRRSKRPGKGRPGGKRAQPASINSIR